MLFVVRLSYANLGMLYSHFMTTTKDIGEFADMSKHKNIHKEKYNRA